MNSFAPTLASAVLLFAACQREAPHLAPAPEAYVLTTFYPLTWFAQRIAGHAVEVACPLPEDADPIFWQPSRDAIAWYQGARLILVNGADFERWLPTVSLPQSRVVDTAAGFRDRFLKFANVTHSHGAGGEHTHEGIDGHTWVDPLLAKVQAKAIADALARAFPQHAGTFGPRLEALHRDLDGLHSRLHALGPGIAGVRLLASHPAYNYLAARHGWRIVNLDLDPGAALGEEDLAKVREAVSGAARAALLWEEAPVPATVAKLAELGITSVVFSPAENPGAAELARGEDYLSIMRGNLDRLEKAVR